MYTSSPIIIILFKSQRFASEKEGDREVQRTMLELLNQLDGFSSHSDIKVSEGNITYCHNAPLTYLTLGNSSYK